MAGTRTRAALLQSGTRPADYLLTGAVAVMSAGLHLLSTQLSASLQPDRVLLGCDLADFDRKNTTHRY